jgi:hypothetical protein
MIVQTIFQLNVTQSINLVQTHQQLISWVLSGIVLFLVSEIALAIFVGKLLKNRSKELD